MRRLELLRQWSRRTRLFLRTRAAEQAMDDELRHHIAMETAARVRAGQSPDDAQRSAVRDFGGLDQVKEAARDARGVRPLEDFAADLRYSIRVLRRNPGFTTAAILTFALGIGAAGAVFSVAYGVVLRPLPYADPARLVAVWERNIPRNKDRNVVSMPAFEAWRDRTTAFDGVVALVPRPVTLRHEVEAERIAGAEVSPGYFRLLGVSPMLGRPFEDHDTTGAAAAIVLSHGFWVRTFGADPAAIGRTLVLSGKPYTVVGVMPPSFEPPAFGWLGAQDLWFPFVATPQTHTWGRFLLVIARLKNDAGLELARTQLTQIAQQMANDTPANQGWGVTVVPLTQQIAGDVRTPLFLLLGAVVLLLVMAVTNVATLTVSLMRTRAQELATRRSLGATDRRLFHQLLTEGALLGGCGSAVGLILVAPLVGVLIALAPADMPRLGSINVDGPVVGAITAAGLLATVALATVGARRGRSLAIASGLRVVGDSRTAARAGTGVLMVAEVAVALALTIVATLMVRSLVQLRAVDFGFTAENVVAARISLVGPRFDSRAKQQAFFDALLDGIRKLPGVAAAGRVSTRPLAGAGPATEAVDPMQSHDAPTRAVVADIRYVDAAFFRTLQIPIVQGAPFEAAVAASAPTRVVISESLAEALWPRQHAVGRRLHFELYNGILTEVAGVVRDVHIMDPRTPVRPIAFLPDDRFPSDTRDIVVRAAGEAAIVASLRRVVASLDPAVPLYQVAPLSDLVDRTTASDRFLTLLLSAFAALALALGAVGVFGVISGDVARRRKEIGIRMALGARASSVVGMMLRRTLAPALWGVAAGSILAAMVTYSMRSLLFGVAPHDIGSFVGVAALLMALATVATLIPTRHALHASPVDALRES